MQRQSKTVIADEEKQIRETAHRFTTELFTLKKGESFKQKSKVLKPMITQNTMMNCLVMAEKSLVFLMM